MTHCEIAAVHLLSTAWKNVKQQTIVNCYRKAGFQIQTVELQNAVTDDDLRIPTCITQTDFDHYMNHDSATPCQKLYSQSENNLPTQQKIVTMRRIPTANDSYTCLQMSARPTTSFRKQEKTRHRLLQLLHT